MAGTFTPLAGGSRIRRTLNRVWYKLTGGTLF
jgi:hypothetical protein